MLNGVLEGLVSETQSALIQGRQISDGILVINVAASYCKKEKRQMLLLKVDFTKAYDSISWQFFRFYHSTNEVWC